MKSEEADVVSEAGKEKKQSLLEKYNIPVENLSYEYIGKCSKAKELERIVRILRSGEEGVYPHLTKFAEDRLSEVKPDSAVLRIPEPVIPKYRLEPSERRRLDGEIGDWLQEMRTRERDLKDEKVLEADREPLPRPAVRKTTAVRKAGSMEPESDSDSDSGADQRSQHEVRRLQRHAFEPYFRRALGHGGLAKHLGQRGPGDSTAYILLCAAIQRGDSRAASALLRHYCRGPGGRSDPGKDVPLHLAVLAGSPELVELLLARGARARACLQDQREPLHLACDRRASPQVPEAARLAMARLLLEHGANVNALERTERDSPLILAVRGKFLEVARLLLGVPGVDRHHANRRGETALHVAFAENAGVDMAELLWDDRADLQRVDRQGLSALSYAVRNLVNAGFGAPLSFGEALRPVRFLLDRGVSVNSRLDRRANRVLHMICQNHAAHTLGLFLERGAEVNARNDDGKTPLHFCAENQSPALVELLIQHGADVRALTDERQSVLHFAAANRNAGVLDLLLRHGGLDVNGKARDGNFTPLFNAVWANRAENARLLLEWRARVNERIINGQVVLHVAVDQKHADIAELLLRYGAELEATDDYANRPLGISLYQIADSAGSSDWSDEGEEAEVLRPAEAVQRVLTRHAALLRASGRRPLGERSLRVLESAHFREHFDECLAELERARGFELADGANLLHLLTRTRQQLVVHARNERLLAALRRADCARAFPIYGRGLERDVGEAVERLRLLGEAAAGLDRLMRGLGEDWADSCLPSLVSEHVLGYLNDTELRNLASMPD